MQAGALPVSQPPAAYGQNLTGDPKTVPQSANGCYPLYARMLRLLSKAAIPATAASSKLMSRPVAPGAGPLSMRSQHPFSHDHGDNDQGREANDGCRKHIPFGRIHLLAPEKGGLLRCARSSERLDKACETANNSAEFFFTGFAEQ